MSTVTIRGQVNRYTASHADLAADYKARGMERHRAWDQLIIDRGLQPGINAKEFYAIFDNVTACALVGRAESVGFEATHRDTMFGDIGVSIRVDAQGVYRMVWANGMTGSQPPFMPPDAERFVALG
jgi:hypothetical protein